MADFEPSFKATQVDEESQTVEVVGGQQRVWISLNELQGNIAGLLLLLSATSNWLHLVILLFLLFQTFVAAVLQEANFTSQQKALLSQERALSECTQ